jgi:hypothetical protein
MRSISGWISCSRRVELRVRSVSGKSSARLSRVKSRIAMPKDPNETTLSSTIRLISGVSRKVCQMNPIGIR